MEEPDDVVTVGSVRIPTRVLMAPLAGITNGPFRVIAAEAGCRAFWTEMISAEGLVRRREEVLELLPHAGEPHPVAVQLFGADPVSVAEAATMAEAAGADIIDLNMACPVQRIVRTGAGAQLMREPAKATALVAAVASRVRAPVTVKLRTGWSRREQNALPLARAVVAAGAAAVIIHGRSREQGFGGRADHTTAGIMARELAVPVVVSGDVTTPQEAGAVLEATAAAAVMVGRAALGRPWIFGRIEHHLRGGADRGEPAAERQLELALRHLDLLLLRFEERRALTLYRPHLVAYLRGRPGAAAWRKELILERSPARLRERLAAAVRGSA